MVLARRRGLILSRNGVNSRDALPCGRGHIVGLREEGEQVRCRGGREQDKRAQCGRIDTLTSASGDNGPKKLF